MSDLEGAMDTAMQSVLGAIGGVAGGAHNTVPPQGGAFPVIVYALAPSQDDEPRYGGRDGVQHFDYDVKVIAPLSAQSGVAAILAAVHAALQGVPMTITGGTHMQTLRVRRMPRYPEQLGNVTYLHRGGTYRVSVSPGP